MRAEVFLDTNILLYAVSTAKDEDEASKATRARELLARADFGLSTQVLQEFFVNATRKIASPLTDAQALELIEIVAAAPLVVVDLDIIVQAVALKQRYGLSYWDSAIVAAAHALHADTLYTEDLNHGQVYGQVRAINPFAS